MKLSLFAFVAFAAFSFFVLIIHYWITAKVERAGVPVKYIGYISDWQRLYGQYLALAKESGWPVWPYYFVQSAYAGILGMGLTVVFDPSVIQSVQGWANRLLEWMAK